MYILTIILEQPKDTEPVCLPDGVSAYGEDSLGSTFWVARKI